MTTFFPVIALAAILAAIAYFLSARGAKAELARRIAEEEKTRSELEAARKAIGESRAEAKGWREEATGLRADLEKSKKKAYEQQEASKRAGGAPALREELDKVASRLAEARAEAEHQSARVLALQKDLEKSQAELAKARARAQEAVPAPQPQAPPPPPPPDVAEAAAKLAAETDRADKAEARSTELRKKLSEVEKELKAARGRLETERRVFVVQKGELELAHDRYAELKRRNDALRKDHDELVEAVRQAAREERELARKTENTEESPPHTEESPPSGGESERLPSGPSGSGG